MRTAKRIKENAGISKLAVKDSDFMRRFDKCIGKTTDCWLWCGYTLETGYGVIHYMGQVLMAHRISFLLSKGDLPVKKIVAHSCRNRSCVNPDHLMLATKREVFYLSMVKN